MFVEFTVYAYIMYVNSVFKNFQDYMTGVLNHECY